YTANVTGNCPLETCNTRVFVGRFRLTKINQRADVSGSLVQEPMTEFHLGHTLLVLEGMFEPLLLLTQIGIFGQLFGRGHPTVPLPKKADKKGAAAIDLRETGAQNPA